MEKWEIEHTGFLLSGTVLAQNLLIALLRKGILTAEDGDQIIANALSALAPETRLPETAPFAEAASGYLLQIAALLQARDPRTGERKPTN